MILVKGQDMWKVVLAATVALSGCTSMVVSTVMELAAIDPLEADPAGFGVMLDLPEGLGLVPGTAVMQMSAVRKDTGENLSRNAVLENDGEVWRIVSGDVQGIRDWQATIKDLKAQPGVDVSGSIGIAVEPCQIGDGPAPDARASVSIQIKEDGTFLPLVRNGPISAVAGDADLGQMASCP
jgi:hypothetical protein